MRFKGHEHSVPSFFSEGFMGTERRIAKAVSGIALFLGICLAGELLLIPFGEQLRMLFESPERLRAFSSFYGTVFMYLAAFPAGILYYLLTSSGTPPKDEGLLDPKSFFIFAAVSYFLVFTGDLIGLSVMGRMDPDAVNAVEEMAEQSSGLYLTLVASLLAPVCEELLFRKFLIDGLYGLGERTAVLVSAFLFALSHGNLFQFFYTLFAGLFFAYIYVRTGNILNSILLHMTVNLMGGLIPAMLLRSGGLEAQAAAAGYSFLTWVIVFVGMFFFFRLVRHLKFENEDFARPFSGAWMKAVFLNPGMLLFLLVSGVYVFLSIYTG